MLVVILWVALLGAVGVRVGVIGSLPAPAGRDTKAIVRALEVRYHSAATLKATFLERFREDRKDVRTEAGTVYFSRSGRMRWEYESPEKKLFVADGRSVWFYVPADHTVTRARMKQSADWRTPFALLAGKATLSRFCGRIELAEDNLAATGRSAGNVLLRCWPRGESSQARSGKPDKARGAAEDKSSFHEVLLEVDASRNELVRVLIREAGGVEIEFRFANWQQDLPLPEAMFHFQPPPGVAIVNESTISGPLR